MEERSEAVICRFSPRLKVVAIADWVKLICFSWSRPLSGCTLFVYYSGKFNFIVTMYLTVKSPQIFFNKCGYGWHQILNLLGCQKYCLCYLCEILWLPVSLYLWNGKFSCLHIVDFVKCFYLFPNYFCFVRRTVLGARRELSTTRHSLRCLIGRAFTKGWFST